MLSKRWKILIVTAVILLLVILAFSEYRTKSFVHTFITDPNELEQKVDRITIWKQELDSNSNISVASISSNDESFNEVLLAFKDWEVKKLFFGELDSSNTTYTITMTNNEKSIYKENFNVLMLKDGMMNINGREYKLVNGPSLDEVIEMMKKE